MQLYLIVLVREVTEIPVFDGFVHKECIPCLPYQLKTKVFKTVPEQLKAIHAIYMLLSHLSQKKLKNKSDCNDY